jgi:hypothetical protein
MVFKCIFNSLKLKDSSNKNYKTTCYEEIISFNYCWSHYFVILY